MHRLIFSLAAILALSACAAGKTTEYRGTSGFGYTYKGNKSIVVGIHDQRPYVLSRDKDESFVGLNRSLYGVPYSMTTRSGNPLAQDFGDLIAATMQQSGVKAKSIRIPPFASAAEATNTITKEQGAGLIYLQVKEWKTDIHFHPALFYTLTASVLDPSGEAIASKTVSGKDAFGEGQRPERQNLAAAVTDILGTLLNSGELVAALDAKPAKHETKKSAPQKARATDRCSVDQVIQLTKMGMSDQQIKAACN